MSEKLEQVTSAVLAEAYKTGGVYLSLGLAKAISRAAIEAMRVPTDAMAKAGWDVISANHPEQSDLDRGVEVDAWQAMIDEVLK